MLVKNKTYWILANVTCQFCLLPKIDGLVNLSCVCVPQPLCILYMPCMYPYIKPKFLVLHHDGSNLGGTVLSLNHNCSQDGLYLDQLIYTYCARNQMYTYMPHQKYQNKAIGNGRHLVYVHTHIPLTLTSLGCANDHDHTIHSVDSWYTCAAVFKLQLFPQQSLVTGNCMDVKKSIYNFHTVTSCHDHRFIHLQYLHPNHCVTHINHVFYGVKEWKIVLGAIRCSMLPGYLHFHIDTVEDDLKNQALRLVRGGAASPTRRSGWNQT